MFWLPSFHKDFDEAGIRYFYGIAWAWFILTLIVKHDIVRGRKNVHLREGHVRLWCNERILFTIPYQVPVMPWRWKQL
jgi:hypothetical protein